eukprot:8607066-Karenia_brevis.AAC.1
MLTRDLLIQRFSRSTPQIRSRGTNFSVWSHLGSSVLVKMVNGNYWQSRTLTNGSQSNSKAIQSLLLTRLGEQDGHSNRRTANGSNSLAHRHQAILLRCMWHRTKTQS